jgi:hypothetical protein
MKEGGVLLIDEGEEWLGLQCKGKGEGGRIARGSRFSAMARGS